MPSPVPRFECSTPIPRVEDLAASVRYYVHLLGFANASWGDEHFKCVSRDGAGLYLCRGGQGHVGAWAWIGVEDVRALHRAYQQHGARIRQGPTKHPWALEILVRDLDGNVLRFGSEPEEEA
jgi:catechol 2,3-dioxygenase-like lactoylglutathione lyase family enzyme